MIETDTHVFFYRGPFSQWAPSPFRAVLAGDPSGVTRTFANAEQWMMFCKATLFEDREAAEVIAKTPDPRAVKALGRRVRNFDAERWSEMAFEVVCAGNVHKFGQTPTLWPLLDATADKILVEASPTDCVWGIGLAESDPLIFDESRWRGQNLLGLALMVARERLRARDADS